MAEKKPNPVRRPNQGVRPTTTHSGVVHVRACPTKRFTVVGNHLLQHRELSLIAIGLASHILSLPDGAPVDIRSLAERFPEGRDRIAFALRELVAHGYLERVREHTETGRIATRTYAHHAPLGPPGNLTCDRGAAPRPASGGRGTQREDDRGGLRTPRPPAPPAPPAAAESAASPEPPAMEPASPAPPAAPESVTGLAAPASVTGLAAPASALVPALPASSPVPAAPASPASSPVPAAPASLTAPEPDAPPGAADAPGPRHEKAVALLAGLRRTDHRLTLSRRDVHRLAPAVTAWFDVGVTAATVHHTLTADLPLTMKSPAGVLAYRLQEQLPPPLPPRQAPAPSATAGAPVRPHPFQTCDGCERAFRAPHPGHCRDCRPAPPGDAVTGRAA
ncbi:helix-turn-helix domain-containing protein [Streptomyces sp. NPDC005573]|uniref:helix-turn-helix domain-containing protein n=1 Tax=Streptomyces sp. NPDC005573 TaxID=3156890 RepID=UPI0033B4B487